MKRRGKTFECQVRIFWHRWRKTGDITLTCTQWKIIRWHIYFFSLFAKSALLQVCQNFASILFSFFAGFRLGKLWEESLNFRKVWTFSFSLLEMFRADKIQYSVIHRWPRRWLWWFFLFVYRNWLRSRRNVNSSSTFFRNWKKSYD